MLEGLKEFKLPEIEEKVLKFWKEADIFKKSLKAREGKRPFRFFEGPPTANGRPGLHHVLARAFKDIICRYKTMRGFFVGRRAGWDTHGLPVELEVEKKLGIKNKSEIEKFGIAEFNSQAKMSVWTYKSEWEKLTERIGFWLDFDHPYITYDNKYIESLWWVFSEIAKKGYLKKLYKIVPWCPRCQTPLSSHELGQPGAYKLTKDPSVFVKFKLSSGGGSTSGGKRRTSKEFLLVWTTTPWTLPANVAVAVNPKITYTKYKVGDEFLWSYNAPPKSGDKEAEVVEKISGKKLVGLEYEPLYKLAGNQLPVTGYKVIAADFVSTEDGTGMVHIAPAFGEEDLKAAGKDAVPVTIDDRGIVNKGLPGAGKFIKQADDEIIADLEKRGLLHSSGQIEHEYPFCWRCSTPLIYFARNSWFFETSRLKEELLKSNKKINWIPSHIQEGRFGEWLKDVRDWSISRNRYWGTPIPIWECAKDENHRLVVGSLEDLNKHAYNKNEFFMARHCESDHNVSNMVAYDESGSKVSKLTKKGITQAEALGKALAKEGIDLIFTSPYFRTRETSKIIAKATGAKVAVDKRLAELNCGVFNGRDDRERKEYYASTLDEFTKAPPGGENLNDARRRMMEAVLEINSQHQGKKILIVSHGHPLWVMSAAVEGLTSAENVDFRYPKVGEYQELNLKNWPFDKNGELDTHRPFIDEVYLKCPECYGKMQRIKDVADVWFDSGAMPFAQWHYPFENKEKLDGQPRRARAVGEPTGASAFPADYIAEGMDQTRGWFYTLLAVSTLLGRGLAYRNVISFGLLLDKNGQKMSKSKGNVVDPWLMIQKYGSDVVRWYFYTVNPPGEFKKFDELDLGKTLRKIFMLSYNSFVFYSTYGQEALRQAQGKPIKVLDQWITSRLHQVAETATAHLEKYEIGEAAKVIEAFVDDLSRWYIRRSRKNVSGKTLKLVLETLAKLMAPFAPFFGEALYKSLGAGYQLSVHLEDWVKVDKKLIDKKLLVAMAEVRHLASLALAEREKAGIKVRQPLNKLKVKSEKLKNTDKELLGILRDEVNVKEVICDPKLKTEVELDVELTPELREEGTMRDLVRMIQGLRGDANYQPKDSIIVSLELPSDLMEIVDKRSAQLKKDVHAKSIEFKKAPKFDVELNSKIENWPVRVALRKA
ncbi:MAG: class I tRNA ligase family protein [Patescibacteria group bacterium]